MQGTAPGAIGDDRGADWPFVSPSEDQARGAGSCLGLVFDVRASPVSRSGAPGVSGIGSEPGQAHICRRSSWLTRSGLAETSPSVCQANPCSGSGRAHTRWCAPPAPGSRPGRTSCGAVPDPRASPPPPAPADDRCRLPVIIQAAEDPAQKDSCPGSGRRARFRRYSRREWLATRCNRSSCCVGFRQ